MFYYRLTNEQLCNDTDGRQNYCFELKVEMKVVMIVESERYRRALPAFSVFGAPSFRFWREPSSTRQAVARLAAQFFHVDVYRREAKADVSRGNNGTNNPLLFSLGFTTQGGSKIGPWRAADLQRMLDADR